ncbi:MAG TPA: universal stress protein [Conexibacter sp.]|jgi:nucleotide-binding universal stress UspA family protein|nr:universal stress protein [Conexibacter sp.]
MSAKVFVSYDDTANDRDALALGRLLGETGAELTLVYVRHAHEADAAREQVEQNAAAELLQRGALALGAADARQLVVTHPSTGEGLLQLAEREGADVVVFGSDYRTPPGAVQPGTSAARLLDGGAVAVAIAPAGLHRRLETLVTRIGVLAERDDAAPDQTARSLAEALDAEVVPADGSVDLLVIGSRPEARAGQLALSASGTHALETAEGAVVALPRGRAVAFDGRHVLA